MTEERRNGDWRQHAEEIFGSRWQISLGEIADVETRTVQRWAAAGRCPDGVAQWLADTVAEIPPDQRRAYGGALRALLRAKEAALAVAEKLRADLAAGRLP